MVLGKGIIGFISSLLLVCVIGNLFLIENCPAAGNTLYVGGTGPGNYTKIQDAIDSSTSGDTIYVMSGTFNENLYIDKSLNLVGNTNPVINGKDPVKSTIEIMSDQVTISNFIIHNAVSATYSGIAIGKTLNQQGDYSSVIILNCDISNVYRGILIRGSSHTVNLCEIYSNDYYAIDIISEGTSHVITENVINENQRGINVQSYCTNIVIRDNTISNNRDYGIHFGAGCANNQISHNRFIENYPQVRDIGTNNSWDEGYPSGGNYWSDYTGYDNYSGINQDIPGSDDIGDIPYNILGGQNKDKYPTGEIQIPQQPGEENQIPNAYIISITPNPAESEQLVALKGSGSDSDGFIITYEWKSTIDGELSDQLEFQTTDLSVGTHTISFKVQDDDGAWSTTKTVSLTIKSRIIQPPIAYIDEITPNPAEQGTPIIFHGHGSDEEGTITEYKWISNKDGVIGTTASFIRANLSHGTHIIFFQVKDNTTWSSQVSANLTITRNTSSGNPENQPPHAYSGGPYSGKVNETITFNGSLSSDEEGVIDGYWTFGDGSSATGLIVTHTYAAPGTYTVVLTVTDEDEVSAVTTTTATVTQSASQGDTFGGFSFLDFEIPFPLLMGLMVLLIVGIIIGFIFKIKQR